MDSIGPCEYPMENITQIGMQTMINAASRTPRSTLRRSAFHCTSFPLPQSVDQPLKAAVTTGLSPNLRRVLGHGVEQVAHSPQAIDHAGCHRGRTTNRTVDAAEVVDRNMDRGRGGKVLNLFGKSQR